MCKIGVTDMIFFIDFLKALAACLITNAHYTGIYPTDLIANGGLIGDILFFAVSGYCLYEVRGTFLKWYSKRIYRCYVSVILMTMLYLFLGFYTLQEHNLFWWLVYPTTYHFVASIVVLYIPYYFVMKSSWLRRRIPMLMCAIFTAAFIYYLFGYDKSYYHIDNVREPMIRVLFFESMLLGAWFRSNDSHMQEGRWWHIPATAVTFLGYFASKLLFSRFPMLSDFQVLNQVLIFALLYFLFKTVSSARMVLECLSEQVKRCIRTISRITLEIYVVQYVLIDLIRPVGMFPLNWILLTGSILLSALLLNRVVVCLNPKRNVG